MDDLTTNQGAKEYLREFYGKPQFACTILDDIMPKKKKK